MNAEQFSPNPCENEDFLRSKIRGLSAQQQEDLIIALAAEWCKERNNTQELTRTVRLLNKQYERAMAQLADLEARINPVP